MQEDNRYDNNEQKDEGNAAREAPPESVDVGKIFELDEATGEKIFPEYGKTIQRDS